MPKAVCGCGTVHEASHYRVEAVGPDCDECLSNRSKVPDIAELSDYLLCERPAVYKAIKYLHADAFYDCAINIWKANGCPDIFESATP